MNVLAYLLAAPLSRPEATLEKWLDGIESCPFNGSVERAIWGGFHADRLGFAFAAGLQSAIRRLFEHAAQVQHLERAIAVPARAALCVTESGGPSPSAIKSRLDKEGGNLVLNGEKTFGTMASLAQELLVVASRGVGTDGKNRLRIVRVNPKAKGVTLVPREPTPFAPELPHAKITFDHVIVEDRDVLPGDGYAHWTKPFGTLEHIHVLAAAAGYLAAVARTYDFARDTLAETISLALSLIDAGARDPSAPLTHVLLAGHFATARSLFETPEWQKANPNERTRFERDKPLLLIAEGARNRRTEVAFVALQTAK